MRRGPIIAVKLLEDRIPINAPPRPIVEWLEEIIVTEGWYSQPEAREIAERWGPRALQEIRKRMNELIQIGKPLRIVLNSSSDYYVQGAAFVEGTEPIEVRVAKQRRSELERYKEALATLSSREFEAMCKGILQLLRVTNPTITPSTVDEGIDFYGRLELSYHIFPEDWQPILQQQLNVWLIGQAKHYQKSKVSTPDLRDLVGAVVLARGRAFSRNALSKFSDLHIKPCDPVFFIFFTTGSISRDGWQLLKRSGIVGMDGEMLAAFLADRGVGTEEGRFNLVAFKNWVSSLIERLIFGITERK